MNLRDNCREAAEKLRIAGIPEAELDAWYLLEYVTGVSRAVYFADPDRELTEHQQETYDTCIRKRAQRIPLQHITGVQEFMGLVFQVNEHVLIPRQDTETLVEEALRLIRNGRVPEADGEIKLLDLCTGSGCILLSVIHYVQKIRGLAVKGTGGDLSQQALRTAETNAKQFGIDAEFIKSDLFEELTGKYDMILSNPPYIRSADIEELAPEVRLHDPRMALDGSDDGLAFYRRITSDSVEFLNNGGILMFEIGFDQALDVSDLMRQHGFSDVTVKKDLAGLDRVVYGRYSK